MTRAAKARANAQPNRKPKPLRPGPAWCLEERVTTCAVVYTLRGERRKTELRLRPERVEDVRLRIGAVLPEALAYAETQTDAGDVGADAVFVTEITNRVANGAEIDIPGAWKWTVDFVARCRARAKDMIDDPPRPKLSRLEEVRVACLIAEEDIRKHLRGDEDANFRLDGHLRRGDRRGGRPWRRVSR